MTRAIAWVCGRLLLLGCAAGCIAIESKPPSNTVLLIKGRLAPAPGGSEDRMTFQTEAGAVYTLVSNGMSMALFVDTNLQSKLLLLKGRVQPGSRRFEVTGNLHSLRDGKVHELYYYCDICAIKGSEPGPCLCCREPVHLIEEPR